MKLCVTGATGTLGSAIVRRLATEERAANRHLYERIVCVSRDEVKQGNLAKELEAARLDEPLRFFLADVRDEQRLAEVFTGCEVVIHTAALKRVDRTAQDPEEVLKTNVLGTANVLRAALAAGIKKVLFVSSDKAVMPTNFYGATKQLGEQLTVAWNAYGYPKGMISSCVRYGNVLGSRGSVLEVWAEARRKLEPILLTHGDMTRFVLTVDQAVDFILSSLERMQGGEVFVPKLSAVRMADVARVFAKDENTDNIRHGDLSLKVTGLRPGGEKLHERLLSDEEPPRTLWQKDRYVVMPWHRSWTTDPYQGERVDPLFHYASDTVGFLDAEQVKTLVKPWLEGA